MGGRCGFAGAVAVCVVASVLAGCGSSSSGMKLTAYLVHGSQETGFTTQGAPTVESRLRHTSRPRLSRPRSRAKEGQSWCRSPFRACPAPPE